MRKQLIIMIMLCWSSVSLADDWNMFGESPVVYPDAKHWKKMSKYRLNNYGPVSLNRNEESEARIHKALDNRADFDFDKLPLSDVVKHIAKTQKIPVMIDVSALKEIGVSTKSPVSISASNITLRSFLRSSLKEFGLTYTIKNEMMQITSVEEAETNLITKIYPVGIFGIPITQ